MPKTITKTVYEFHELSERAKARVKEWLNNGEPRDYEYALDDFERVAELMGFEIHVGRGRNNSRAIYYESNYGWSAAFEGMWRFLNATGCAAKVREYAPQDELLHRIADCLEADMAKFLVYGFELVVREGDVRAPITASTQGVGIQDVNLEWDLAEEFTDGQNAAAGSLCATVECTAKDLCRWLAKNLEAEEESRWEDDYVRETCDANEYLFDEGGSPA